MPAADPTSDDPVGDVVKWYTRARKFPQLIGRTPDGSRIWGGPYTIPQVLAGGSVLLIGLKTMSWWAHFGMINNLAFLGAACAAVVIAMGRLPVGARNPISLATGATRAATAPAAGRIAGRVIRARRARTVSHRVLVLQAVISDPRPAVQPVAVSLHHAPATPSPASVSQLPTRPALSGVQLLLASVEHHPVPEVTR